MKESRQWEIYNGRPGRGGDGMWVRVGSQHQVHRGIHIQHRAEYDI